jgi:3-methyladenine DNA glycosylase Tag
MPEAAPDTRNLPATGRDLGTAEGDGRTRCSWVAGRPEHFAFHDADWGMIPDDEGFARERLILTCFERDMPLGDVLDHRREIWDALHGADLGKVAAMDDAALDAVAALGGIFADRGRLAWVRDVAAAGAETAKQAKEFREYLLAVRFLSHEEQIADMTARFPGFTRLDAARLMENFGTVEGSSHERDCWRA